MKFRFLADVDDVLTLFVSRLLPIIQGVNPSWDYSQVPAHEWDLFSTLEPGQRDALFAVMERPGFCFGFKPDLEAYKMVAKLRTLGGEIFAVTSPNIFPNWCSERTLWLEKHMYIEGDHVIHTEAKYMIRGDFLLDDKPDHVYKWSLENPQGVPLLWSTPHNLRMEGVPGTEFRVRNSSEVITRVEKWCKERE